MQECRNAGMQECRNAGMHFPHSCRLKSTIKALPELSARCIPGGQRARAVHQQQVRR